MSAAPRRLRAGLLAVCAAAPASASQEFATAQSPLEAAASRCIDSSELVSCASALAMKPNDPELLVAEGDALVRLNRPGEAIGVYRHAAREGSGMEAVSGKIDIARERRRLLLDTCRQETGPAAERACEAAWLPGASDEVMLFKRRGLLLQKDGQVGAALDAYMAAARLAPRDREVARAVVELSGAAEHPDAPILTARGAALVTLGRTSDAIMTFREALGSAPELADAKVRLRDAESTLAAQRRTPATVAASPTPQPTGKANGIFSNEAPATRSN